MFDPDDYELHQAQKHACKMAKERDEARVMVDKLTAELAACAAVLPGAYYMDPPDGGDVPVSEQLRRMAKDAVDEIERMRSALDWYAEMAKTMQRATLHVDNQVALHVMKQMALDGGKKAREAMTHNAALCYRGSAAGGCPGLCGGDDMSTIQVTTLAILAGRWQAEADSGAGSPDRRVALRECADVLRMMCEMRFEDCPHAAPHRYCPECRVHPCPIGLDEGPKETT